MLIPIQSSGVAPEVNLRITQAKKHTRDPPWLRNLGQTSVADPGFGQGGAKNFFPRFCRCSEAKSGEQSEQYNISI